MALGVMHYEVFGHVSPAPLSAFDLVDGQDFSTDDASHFWAVMIITKGTVRAKYLHSFKSYGLGNKRSLIQCLRSDSSKCWCPYQFSTADLYLK